MSSLQKEVDSCEAKYNQLKVTTYQAKSELKSSYADHNFWQNIESKESQESCPWYSDKLKDLQSELFVLAMKVNETFILRANMVSSRIMTTLTGFFEYLKGNSSVTNDEAKAMWNTFFLVIPVVSTTFASIQRMFSDLNSKDIPWLFIDEAGQAVPQAAAGAIWRSQRVVAVGDPFQIEPVVTIPKLLTDNISDYFDLNKTQIHSTLSVQSMADRANLYGWYNNNIWIGSPLRIHRRCIDPMFSISNDIAYDGMMYNSTKEKPHSILFETQFISAAGSVRGRHYIPEHGDIIYEILVKEIQYQKQMPDIFIISPFSEIPYILKGELLYRIQQQTKIPIQQIRDWLNSHVGTVHTFQGKQADGVILCLGLDSKSKGAASWASSKPNLLNVALTRAKYRFIAIGDEKIWLKQKYFNELRALKMVSSGL